MSIAEAIRAKAVADLLAVNGVAACWPTWRPAYQAISGVVPTASSLFNDLGGHLGHVFKTTAVQGRAQSELSGGGAAWEALVCWYLNLCLIGTRTVVVKKKSHLPTPLRDALTLSYGASQTNTESDLVAVTFPSDALLDSYAGAYAGVHKDKVDRHLASLMGQIEACVIQCKTNWNDNAQIPMLWDLVYSSQGFSVSGVAIGRNGHSLRTLRRFAYAFITLPSNPTAKFAQNSMPVLRVSKLSGGNYWGFERKNGVAGAIADIFARNFSTSIEGLGRPWLNHLDDELLQLGSTYHYFKY
jgi:hypothetical protein